MRQPLSRIEREYVVGEISLARPSFELAFGEGGSDVCVSEYFLRDDVVTFRYSLPLSVEKNAAIKKNVRVRFLHKKRYMHFFADIQIDSGTASFHITRDIVPDDDEPVSEGDRLIATLSGRTFRCDGLPSIGDVPGSGTVPDTGTLSDDGRVAALAEKMGLSSHHQAARERLYLFVCDVRENSEVLPRLAGRGQCLFLDHTVALVVTYLGEADDTNPFSFDTDKTASVLVEIGSRSIRFRSKILGCLRLTGLVSVVALDCGEAHEEDKRVLFERYYKKIYT